MTSTHSLIRPAHVQAVELSKCYRLLNHGPTVIVTSAHDGKRNIMSAAWSMPLDFNPPKVCVVIDKNTHTRSLVDASGKFALNVPSRRIADATLSVGHHSGRDLDKFAAYGLDTFAAQIIQAPLVQDCVAWLECKVLEEPRNQGVYDLYIGEVLAAWADERVFHGGHWQSGPQELQTLHYVAGGAFFVAGEQINVHERAAHGQTAKGQPA